MLLCLNLKPITEISYIFNKLKNKDFDKLFSLFGLVLENAKERLLAGQS